MPLEINAENPYDSVFTTLTGELVDELMMLYGPGDDEEADGFDDFQPADVAGPRSVFVVAWLDGEAVGCGALRPMDADTVEIKRMYVRPSARGQGISRRILQSLETHAQAFAYRKIRLGTGDQQPEAIQLYATSGYDQVTCADPYLDDHSVCFEKLLGQ
jgi:GNAT superfamily N-acetyltransferase